MNNKNGSLVSPEILVVDDHALVRAGFRILLEDIEGVEVIAETGDGRAVLDLVESERADIVLMDVSMPGMNGIEATRLLRRNFDAQRLPIIAQTAAALASEREQCLEAGMNDFVSKPIDINRLQEVLRHWVRR